MFNRVNIGVLLSSWIASPLLEEAEESNGALPWWAVWLIIIAIIVLFVLSRRKRGDGLIIGTLLVLYSVFRTVIEFFREPDVQLGFIFGPFTMGQLLTAPMVIAGGWLVWRALRAGAPKDPELEVEAGESEDAG